MVYFTSDLHFNHNKDFIYNARGFNSIEEHDREVIKRWNETVNEDDTVYVLGDLIMGQDRESTLDKISRLKGNIIFVRGNHDTDKKVSDCLTFCNNISEDSVQNEYMKVFKWGKKLYYLSHHPVILGDIEFESKNGRFPVATCLHGHTHSKDRFEYLHYCCYNVGLDAHDMRPVDITEIVDDIGREVTNRKSE